MHPAYSLKIVRSDQGRRGLESSTWGRPFALHPPPANVSSSLVEFANDESESLSLAYVPLPIFFRKHYDFCSLSISLAGRR